VLALVENLQRTPQPGRRSVGRSLAHARL
jgi:hypothetical protein